MVGNGVGGNLEGMVSVYNRVRKFLTHMLEDGSASTFKDDWLDEFSRSSYSTAIAGFSSVRNRKIDNDVPW